MERIPPSTIGFYLNYAAIYSRLCSWRHVPFLDHTAAHRRKLLTKINAQGGMRFAFPLRATDFSKKITSNMLDCSSILLVSSQTYRQLSGSKKPGSLTSPMVVILLSMVVICGYYCVRTHYVAFLIFGLPTEVGNVVSLLDTCLPNLEVEDQIAFAVSVGIGHKRVRYPGLGADRPEANCIEVYGRGSKVSLERRATGIKSPLWSISIKLGSPGLISILTSIGGEPDWGRVGTVKSNLIVPNLFQRPQLVSH